MRDIPYQNCITHVVFVKAPDPADFSIASLLY